LNKSIYAVAGIASLVAAAVAEARTDCPEFIPGDWSITSTGSTGSGGVSFAGGNSLMTLVSSDDGSFDSGSWRATWFANDANFVSFNWSVVSSPDSGGFDTFGYTLNGVYTQLANNNTLSGLNWTGLNLNAGDVFGFRIDSSDNIGGALTVNVECLIPAPGAVALFGLAGLKGRRRRN